MNRVLTALVAAAALWSAACSGGGGSNIQPPPPTGNYSLADLNGTYAFITNGEVFDGNSFNPLARVGSFVADGQGHITDGVEDVNEVSFGVTPAISITGGSYTVNPDGRGVLTLDLGSSSIDFGITLTSTSDGLMIDETNNSSQASTGSGNFIRQNVASFTTPVPAITGPYVFDFAGFDESARPESFVGQFEANGGVITTSLGDDNDNGNLSNGTFTGTFAQDPLFPGTLGSSGRGIATIAGLTYVFYVVDATRVRFMSTSGGTMLTGDVVSQTNIPSNLSAINGGFAFLVAGSSVNGGLVRVGRFDVSGNTLSKVVMDVNDGAHENQFPSSSLTNSSISYDPTTGRGQLSFQSSVANVYSFVFYLSSAGSGVLQEVSGTPGTGTAVVVDDGSLLAQSGSPFTSSNISGPYAMNWSGLVTAGGNLGITDEEDLLSQVAVTSLSLSGTSDYFQFTGVTLHTDVGTGGQITLNGDGTSNNTMSVNLSGVTPIHMVVYIVNPQLAFFANRDNNGAMRIVAGILKAQQ